MHWGSGVSGISGGPLLHTISRFTAKQAKCCAQSINLFSKKSKRARGLRHKHQSIIQLHIHIAVIPTRINPTLQPTNDIGGESPDLSHLRRWDATHLSLWDSTRLTPGSARGSPDTQPSDRHRIATQPRTAECNLNRLKCSRRASDTLRRGVCGL